MLRLIAVDLVDPAVDMPWAAEWFATTVGAWVVPALVFGFGMVVIFAGLRFWRNHY